MKMCTASNLVNISPWHLSKPTTNNLTEYSSSSNISHNPKPKFSNYRMLIVNNLNKREERNFDDDLESKYFLSPLRTFQLTPEECNEILLKRAALLPESSQHNTTVESSNVNKDSPESDTNTNFTQVKLRPYSCTECGKTFIQKHHLTTHTKVHSGIRPHTCTHCGKSFTHKHCLNTHLLLHSSDRPYQCSECKKSFTLKHHLISHAKVHSREKPFICTDCGCAFPLKRHLVTHAKFHAGERPFVCNECGESFAQKDHLVMHSRFHGSVNSFACHECSATFSRKFELVNHSRLHGHVPLRCPVCNKEFMQKRTLVVHMRVHTGETPFNCLICGGSFHLRNELTVHMTTHNDTVSSNSEGKLLHCSECNSSFNNPEALALHIKLHSGDASLVNDLCTLTASLQGTNFPVRGNMKINQQPSNGCKTENSEFSMVAVKIKSYICKFCLRAFSAKHGLQQHNRRHPEGTCSIKSHICEMCNKAFYQKNHLLLHQRQHMEPSLRNLSYSKLQSNLEPNSSEQIESFYSRSQISITNLQGTNTKIFNPVNENTANINFTTKTGSYMSHNEISSSKFKDTEEKIQVYNEHGDIEGSESYPEKGSSVKNSFLQHNAHYTIENLRNVDVKMHISDDIAEDVSYIKNENANYSIIT